jgi:hypothetical protein
MRLLINTLATISYLISGLLVINFISCMVQYLVFDMITTKMYIARIGITFLGGVIVIKTLIECDTFYSKNGL